jgi:hypothetical protein
MGLAAAVLTPDAAQAYGWKKGGTAVVYAPAPVAYAPVVGYAPQVAYPALAPQPATYYYPAAAASPVPYAPAPTVASAPQPAAAPPQLRTYVINGYSAVLSDEQAAKLGLSPAGSAPGASPAVGSAPPAEPGSVLTGEADLQAVLGSIQAKADELKRSGKAGFDLLTALNPEAERAYAARANRPVTDLNAADRKTIDTLTARALGFTGADASGQTAPQRPATPTPTAQPAPTTAQSGAVYLLAPAAYVPMVPVEVRPKHGLFHHKW